MPARRSGTCFGKLRELRSSSPSRPPAAGRGFGGRRTLRDLRHEVQAMSSVLAFIVAVSVAAGLSGVAVAGDVALTGDRNPRPGRERRRPNVLQRPADLPGTLAAADRGPRAGCGRRLTSRRRPSSALVITRAPPPIGNFFKGSYAIDMVPQGLDGQVPRQRGHDRYGERHCRSTFCRPCRCRPGLLRALCFAHRADRFCPAFGRVDLPKPLLDRVVVRQRARRELPLGADGDDLG